jgi:hypothetical protein
MTLFFNLTISAQNTYGTYSEARYGKLEYGFFIPDNYDKTKL